MSIIAFVAPPCRDRSAGGSKSSLSFASRRLAATSHESFGAGFSGVMGIRPLAGDVATRVALRL